MSEQIKIEDVINETLTGDTQKNALDFVAFLRTNDHSIEWDGTWWCVQYKGDCPILLGINTGGVKFGALFNYSNFGSDNSVDDDLREVAWGHVQMCRHFESDGKKCGCGDQPGLVTIFDKEFNACKSPLTFIDPNAKTLDKIKQLILLLKSSTDMKYAEQAE